jgi:hypothetical protein
VKTWVSAWEVAQASRVYVFRNATEMVNALVTVPLHKAAVSQDVIDFELLDNS